MRARAWLHPVLATALTLSGAVGVLGASVSLAPSAGAAPADLRINEVESNGDPTGDWAEIVNTGSATFDLSGYRFKDNDDTHAFYTVPAGTTVAAGAYYVFNEADFGFGLGGADSARLFAPAGGPTGDAELTSYSWTAHAATTYGRCPDATGAFTTTTSSTKGAVNDCSSPVRINEVESSGGEPGDWVELVNTGTSAADVSGFFLKDSDDTRTFTIAAATSIAPGGYLVLDEAAFGFGLGAADSARLFAADGSTPVDSYAWTAHAATTYGRCPDGAGAFTTTSAPTKGLANQCPGAIVTKPWPGSQDVVTVDAANVLGGDISGLTYEAGGSASPDTLLAVNNGTGTLVRLTRTGATWATSATNVLTYPGGSGVPDTEGVTLGAQGSASGVYVSTERNNSANTVSRPAILRYDVPAGDGALRATHDWNLTADLPVVAANAGLEAIAFVPDAYLVGAGLRDDSTGLTYDPSRYDDHRGGLFLVGLEGNGRVYAYALDHAAGTFSRVASFASGFPAVMDLHFEASTQQLWVVCDDTCQGRIGVFGVTDGAFAAQTYYERPTGMPNLNNEGFTQAGPRECVDGLKPAFWSDDSNTGGFALRAGTVPCVAGPPDPTDPTVEDPTITAALSSDAPPSASGWYAGPVVVTFACTPNGSPLVGDCPDPVVLTSSGADQVVSATITAEDGGTATVEVAVDVDLDDPVVTVRGIRDGRVYRGEEPTARCTATDVTSRVEGCTVTTRRNGTSVTVVATATDLAGNTAVATLTYQVPLVQVLNARFNGARYVVQRGQAFTVRAVLASSSRPRLLRPVGRGDELSGVSRSMRATDPRDDISHWQLRARVGDRTTGARWKVGVLVGGSFVVIGLKVRG